jgi:hypothetical protein
MLRRLRVISIWLFVLLGLAAVIVGYQGSKGSADSSLFLFQMASIGGSALFGASLSLLIEQTLGTDVSDIRNYLLQKERFESAPDHLDAVTGEWHHYDLSKANGKRVWQYLKFSLFRGEMNNTLAGSYLQTGPEGNTKRYTIEAGIRGGSLITTMRAAEGDEHDQIQMIPNITRTHLTGVVGLQILETWDGDLCQSYVIYSRKKLVESDHLSADDGVELDRILLGLLKRSGLDDLRLPASKPQGPI